jgi:ABC-type dipeptide/oligopeptide/nickel transport system permease subunit
MPSRNWWIIGVGLLVVAALFLGMNLTNKEMRESGQPSPEHLQQESGDDPGEQ